MSGSVNGFYNPRGMSPLERAKMDNAYAEMQARKFTKDNIPKGGLFIANDVLYQATQALPKGTEIKPGVNCTIKSLEEIGGN